MLALSVLSEDSLIFHFCVYDGWSELLLCLKTGSSSVSSPPLHGAVLIFSLFSVIRHWGMTC